MNPYFKAIANRHPDLRDPLSEMLGALTSTHTCLTHGDYSPKNLMVTPKSSLVLLDHEVAHWGNPAFDAAFTLNHLCLKAMKFQDRADEYLSAATAFWKAYVAEEPPDNGQLARETAWLLGWLMLARVDGKSPVEYLTTEVEQSRVRQVARRLITDRVSEPAAVFQSISERMSDG